MTSFSSSSRWSLRGSINHREAVAGAREVQEDECTSEEHANKQPPMPPSVEELRDEQTPDDDTPNSSELREAWSYDPSFVLMNAQGHMTCDPNTSHFDSSTNHHVQHTQPMMVLPEDEENKDKWSDDGCRDQLDERKQTHPQS